MGNTKFQFANMPFERGEILFSKGFSVYTDIRKLQDKAKTSYTLTVSERCQSSIPCQKNRVS